MVIYNKVPPKFDSNCVIDVLHALKQLENEILKVEQELKCLEDNDHMRRYLKIYLNILYEARMFLVGKLALVVAEWCLPRLKYLQAILKPYAEINTTKKLQLSTYDVTMLVFLVVSIQALLLVDKGNKQDYSCAANLQIYPRRAKKLCDSSHIFVPSNTLIVWPVSVKDSKRPLKEQQSQNEVRVVLLNQVEVLLET